MIARFLRTMAGAAVALSAALAFAQTPVPKLTGHVVDLTGTLGAPAREALDAKLAGFEKERGSQVVVLMVPSIGDETIEEFAGRVTDEWKLGRKGVDDGVLFVVAMHERRLRIAPGRGLSGSLTDILSKRIVSDIVAPHFKAGDFVGGIDAGADAIMKAIEGEALPLPKQRAQAKGHGQSGNNLLFIGLFVVFVGGLVLRSLFGRFFGAAATSGIAAVIAWFALGSVAIVVVAAIAAFIFTLVSGTGLGRGFIPVGGFGGGGFGGGGGGGGGGGFSGGGGGFDGGGASGSW